jgi:chromosome segregation ATPase
MQELDKRIGLLRLLLADIQGKQAQLREMETQYREQLSRIVDFVVFREGDVSNALSLMTDVQSKLNEVVQTADHLRMIKDRAAAELDALVLTKQVADARSQLAELEARQKELADKLADLPAVKSETVERGERTDDIADIREEVEGVSSEIARLHNLIAEASERAARTIQLQKA